MVKEDGYFPELQIKEKFITEVDEGDFMVIATWCPNKGFLSIRCMLINFVMPGLTLISYDLGKFRKEPVWEVIDNTYLPRLIPAIEYAINFTTQYRICKEKERVLNELRNLHPGC